VDCQALADNLTGAIRSSCSPTSPITFAPGRGQRRLATRDNGIGCPLNFGPQRLLSPLTDSTARRHDAHLQADAFPSRSVVPSMGMANSQMENSDSM